MLVIFFRVSHRFNDFMKLVLQIHCSKNLLREHIKILKKCAANLRELRKRKLLAADQPSPDSACRDLQKHGSPAVCSTVAVLYSPCCMFLLQTSESHGNKLRCTRNIVCENSKEHSQINQSVHLRGVHLAQQFPSVLESGLKIDIIAILRNRNQKVRLRQGNSMRPHPRLQA